jgi:hypothetical protein
VDRLETRGTLERLEPLDAPGQLALLALLARRDELVRRGLPELPVLLQILELQDTRELLDARELRELLDVLV